jgi:multidrug resistance protein, MATE family
MSGRTLVQELGPTLRLASPIMAGQFGQMLMALTDTLFLGHVGSVPLAAVALTNIVITTLYVFGIGVLSSVGVLASQAHGAGLHETKTQVFRSAVWLSVLVGLSLSLLALLSTPGLPWFGATAEVEQAARIYIFPMAWSLLFMTGFTGAKTFCEATGRPTAPMVILYGGVLLNALVNWLLVFGNSGFPRLEILGSGIATLVSRSVVMLVTIGYALRVNRLGADALFPWRLDFRNLGSLLILGLPVGFQLLSEVGCFNFAALMMGWLGTTALAAHQIAINCAATTFMFPLGISQAASIRIGHAIGEFRFQAIRTIGLGATSAAAAVMALFAVLYIVGRTFVAQLFTDDAQVVGLASSLLVVAGLFQVADGIQVTAAGCLRGMADVRAPMILSYFIYWAVAIPLAYSLAFLLGWGPIGIWVGLAIALTLAALILTTRFLWLARPNAPITRLVGEVPA